MYEFDLEYREEAHSTRCNETSFPLYATDEEAERAERAVRLGGQLDMEVVFRLVTPLGRVAKWLGNSIH